MKAFENIMENGENAGNQHFLLFPQCFLSLKGQESLINPLPDMPILGSSNSAANKDMMSKIWTNRDKSSD